MSGSICSRSFADLEWWNTFAADFVCPGDYFSGHLRIFCSNTKVFVGILLQISANKFFSWILVNHEGDIRLMITIRFFHASGWSRQIHSFIHTCFVRSIQSPTKVSMEDIIVMANNQHQFTCIPARTIAKGSLCVTNGNIWCDFLYFIGGLECMHSFTTFLIVNMEQSKWDIKKV